MLISVIIPTLNEANRLPALLTSLRRQHRPADIVVVDGGSTDATLDLAARHGARCLTSAPGRGQQLAAGAEAAHGDVLLFLHADCRFPDHGLAAIAEALSPADVVGGNFRLLFDGDDGFSRWLDRFYAWIRRHGFYYGDSGVFVRRGVYNALGGIRPIALMEDYDFNRRMERHGRTCCIDDPPLLTSSRRFTGRSPLRIVSGWLAIHALFHLGVPPDRLARLYNSRRVRSVPD